MSLELSLGLMLGLVLPIALIVGAVIGYILATKYFKKQMKSNPIINEKQIEIMYQQMGRKPTKKQVKQVMEAFKKSSSQ